MVQDLILRANPLEYGRAAFYKYDDALAKRFTSVSRFGDPFQMWRREGDRILLPRAVCPVGTNDKRVSGLKVVFNDLITLRNEEQGRIVDECVEFLAGGLSGIMQAPTGVGKTVMALKIIAKIGVKTLIVVTKEDLMKVWTDSIEKFLGVQRKQIGLVQQDECSMSGKPIGLAMIHSLAISGRYSAESFADVGLVVWDEVHHVGAESFSRTAMLLPAKLRLGLSATPERKDGKDVLIYANIGPIRVKSNVVRLTPKVLMLTSNWTCPRTYRRNPETGKSSYQRVFHQAGRTMHVVSKMARDENRNAQLTTVIKAAFDKGRTTVVFSDLLDHLEVLRLGCKDRGIPWGEMGVYVGGLSEAQRNVALGRKVVFASYAMMSEGTNAPWLDTVVLTTPRSDVVQVVGRILREYEGKKDPLVIDIEDQDSPVFNGYAGKRKSWYRRIGAPVQRLG